jgi:hypothetical protein
MNNQYYPPPVQASTTDFVPNYRVREEMLRKLKHILLRSEQMKREPEVMLTDDQRKTAGDKEQQFVDLSREDWLKFCM